MKIVFAKADFYSRAERYFKEIAHIESEDDFAKAREVFDALRILPQAICVEEKEGLFAYILTMGDYLPLYKGNLTEEFYADVWGTAVIAACLDLLQERLGAFGNLWPGANGVPHSDVAKVFKVLDGGEIGVELDENNLMHPVKSCAGWLKILGDDFEPEILDCESCLADEKNCDFCYAKIRRASWKNTR